MKYRVGINVSGFYEAEIEADNESDAIEIACENSYSDAEYEYDTEFCYPIEGE